MNFYHSIPKFSKLSLWHPAFLSKCRKRDILYSSVTLRTPRLEHIKQKKNPGIAFHHNMFFTKLGSSKTLMVIHEFTFIWCSTKHVQCVFPLHYFLINSILISTLVCDLSTYFTSFSFICWEFRYRKLSYIVSPLTKFHTYKIKR